MSKLLMILQVHLMSSTCHFILTRWLLEYNISSFDTWKFLFAWVMKVWLGHQWKMKWMSLLWTWLIDQISNFYEIVFLLSKNKVTLGSLICSKLSQAKRKGIEVMMLKQYLPCLLQTWHPWLRVERRVWGVILTMNGHLSTKRKFPEDN